MHASPICVLHNRTARCSSVNTSADNDHTRAGRRDCVTSSRLARDRDTELDSTTAPSHAWLGIAPAHRRGLRHDATASYTRLLYHRAGQHSHDAHSHLLSGRAPTRPGTTFARDAERPITITARTPQTERHPCSRAVSGAATRSREAGLRVRSAAARTGRLPRHIAALHAGCARAAIARDQHRGVARRTVCTQPQARGEHYTRASTTQAPGGGTLAPRPLRCCCMDR